MMQSVEIVFNICLGDSVLPIATVCSSMSCNHSCQLLEQLNLQRQKLLFCDVSVRVAGSQTFPAHRCVLAASSPVLHTLVISVSSPNEPEAVIALDSLTAAGIQPVLDFIYTGKLKLTVDNVQEVYAAACHLDFPDIIKCCKTICSRRHESDDGLNAEVLQKESCYAENARASTANQPNEFMKHIAAGKVMQ
jgi:hypothetical protein